MRFRPSRTQFSRSRRRARPQPWTWITSEDRTTQYSRRDLMSRIRNVESSSTHDSRTQRTHTDSEFTADAERQPRFAAPEPTYTVVCTLYTRNMYTRQRHTSTRRTPACTCTRPYGRRPGASNPGAPSRTSHGHATRPRRPRAAIARATAPSPARTQHLVNTRAKGR